MILSEHAIEYTLKHIGKVAFPGQSCHFYMDKNPQLIVNQNITIQFQLLASQENEDLLQGKMDARYERFHEVEIPFFYSKNIDKEKEEKDLFICADIVTPSFFLLSRYEECRAERFDAHLRFQYAESLCCHYRCIDFPLVDEYAFWLRDNVLSQFPDLQIDKRRFNIVPTHDIDFLCRFSSFFSGWKSILGGDLLRDRSWRQACESVRAWRAMRRNPLADPLMLAIDRLISVSQRAGLVSQFYFKGLHYGEEDATYEIDSVAVRAAMEKIMSAGMVVGMHGGLSSYNNAVVFQREKASLEGVVGTEVCCGRQHFLRFHSEKTVEVWQQCEVKNDSTLGYSEREGFRCGTCHPYYLYDLQRDAVSQICEHPLIVMDTTLLRNYAGRREDALRKVRLLCERCRQVEGDFVILWHNSTMYRTLEPWFLEVYLKWVFG